MTRAPSQQFSIASIGLVDEHGVVGTFLPRTAWPAHEGDPLRAPGAFRRVFRRPDPTYRRIDPVSRALVLAAEAAGVGRFTLEERIDTAIVLETSRGCLESDLVFAAGLSIGTVLGPVFPYTLPSTCLGELALRHGLRGPTLCLSTNSGPAGAALREARALLEEGEATHAIAAVVEVLSEERGGLASARRAVVVCIAPGANGSAIPSWPDGGDAFLALERAMLPASEREG